MVFAFPWMLCGLLGLVALTAIYWLRSRARLRVVSSLIFWTDQRQPRQGGRIFQRMQTPLLFFLELMAIAFIALAAAGPGITRSSFSRPIVVVLDDSYSMQAGGEDSSRRRGVEFLESEFHRTDYIARFVLAGARPRLLSESVHSAAQLHNVLNQWTCASPTAELDQSIAMAAELGGAEARILVMSDHPPDGSLPTGKVRWQALGRALGNVAFTAASRDASTAGQRGLEDRVLLEVTNLGSEAARTEMVLQGADLAAPRRSALELGPGEARRFFLNVAATAPPLRAKLGDDLLAVDNEVVLASPLHRLLRVQVNVAQGGAAATGLRQAIVRALEATGQAIIVDSRPDLLITDRAAERTDAWQLQILRGAEPKTFQGPYVLDRSHPLTQGLSLSAVIWTAAGRGVSAGSPIVSAGNTVLLADLEDVTLRHKLQMVLEPELSNLTDSPDWPIFFANLVRWRLGELPGCSAANVRLGQSVQITLADDNASAKEAILVLPDGAQQTLPLRGRQLELQADQIGLHTVRIGTERYDFACNALNPAESNLKTCVTGRWGDWNQSPVFQDQRASLDWILVLLAIGCLMFHMELLYRARGTAS